MLHDRIQFPRLRWRRIYQSVWFFPLILLIPLLLLTICKISGSSIGVYTTIFSSGTQADPNLLLNKSREIRSDEWVVNTPMTIAQKENSFALVNPNIGNGQNMSVVLDVPYAEWSQLFRPQNWSFFVLPFDNAFAFKWWWLAYLLVLSCYFFILALLPGRRMLAAVLSLSLLFGAMIQWWYQSITLAAVYYPLFMATAAIYLVRARRWLHSALWGVWLAYLTTSFALLLYPPFQIATGLAFAAFMVGYLLQACRKASRKEILQKLGVLMGAGLVAGCIVLAFIQTRSDVIHTITHSDYPGDRVIPSGGFDPAHLFSGNLDFLLQATSKAKHYYFEYANTLAPLNQSEASNFILLLPFLLLPVIYLLIQDYRKHRAPDWPLITITLGFLFFMAWLFIPHLPVLGKVFLLEKVQLVRLLLGLGLLNLFQFVLFARRLPDFTGKFLGRKYIAGYAVLVFLVQVWLGLTVMKHSPGFITWWQVIILSMPVPVIIFLFLRRQILLAAIGLLAFSVFSSGLVNPLYRGTAAATQTPLSQSIRSINAREPGIWVTDIIWLGSFPALNGAQTYSGVYTYPQSDIWRSADNGSDMFIYNRYAHTTFEFDRNPNVMVPTELELIRPDHFTLTTEPCGAYLREKRIRYIITHKKLSENCVQLVEKVQYPTQYFLIYKLP